MMLSEPPVVKKPIASSGAWKSDRPIAMISSSIFFRPWNALAAQRILGEKRQERIAPERRDLVVGLEHVERNAARRQSMSPAERAFMCAKISSRDRTDGGGGCCAWIAKD